MEIEEAFLIGENDHGYKFAVGKIGERWFGFAEGALENGDKMIFFFPGIGENYQLGLLDRNLVIKITGAIAESDEHGYGGIARWFVPEELRGKPEDFTCEHCDSVGCRGDCEDY